MTTASRPFVNSAGVGGAQTGLNCVMATPHQAIAQDGSLAATSLKALAASSYQNECSIATARVNVGCTAGAQEMGNETSPKSAAVP